MGLAYNDMLTGVKNRNAFMKDQEALAVNNSVCYIMMDINGLKLVNDTLGHHYGDDLIRRAALLIQKAFSELGVCYRVGGDEFVVICQNADEAAVKHAIAQMDTQIKAENAAGSKISIACGYAFGGSGIDNVTALFAAADENMYRDKKGSAFARQ